MASRTFDETISAGDIPRADLATWLAFSAATLATFMASLDMSIVNAALPVVQGEIGASGTEGTWVATSYLVAEAVIIPLSAWLTRVLGLRSFMIVMVGLFTVFSVLCGLATSLPMMILARSGQGLTGGAMLPTGMTICAQRFPAEQQPIGNAIYGVMALLGAVIGPIAGGWLTEHISWHYAFFMNVPLGALVVGLMLVALPPQRPHFELLGEADWLGIAGLALGLGGLTVVLEEGERAQWFDSTMISTISVVSAMGFVLVGLGQAYAEKPVIRLRLLVDRTFGSIALMSLVQGMITFGSSYVIPQFLANIAGYNAEQSGLIVMVVMVPSLLLMSFTPWMTRHISIRIAISFGLAMSAAAAFLETNLTSASAGGDFIISQLIRGVGTLICLVYLSQAAIMSLPRPEAGDGAGLFNVARNLGGSVALAAVAVMEDQRRWLHMRRLEELVPANAVNVQDYIGETGRWLGGTPEALRVFAGQMYRQAMVLTYDDLFWLLAVSTAAVIPLVIFLKPLPQAVAQQASIH